MGLQYQLYLFVCFPFTFLHFVSFLVLAKWVVLEKYSPFGFLVHIPNMVRVQRVGCQTSRVLFRLKMRFSRNLLGEWMSWNSLDLVRSCIPQIFLSNELSCTKNRYCMQNFQPRAVDAPTNHHEAHNTFDVLSPIVIFVNLYDSLFMLKGHYSSFL